MKSTRSGKKKLNPDVILYSVILFVLYFLILFEYRQLRSFFPKPSKEDVIGFAQYFGYPLYFDNFIFLAIILSPILAFIIKRIIKKYL